MNIGDMAMTRLLDDDGVVIDHVVMILDIYPDDDPTRALTWRVWSNALDVYARIYSDYPKINEFLDSLSPGCLIAMDLEDLEHA